MHFSAVTDIQVLVWQVKHIFLMEFVTSHVAFFIFAFSAMFRTQKLKDEERRSLTEAVTKREQQVKMMEDSYDEKLKNEIIK